MNQGEKFKWALDKAGLSKTEAAKRMGIARETLYNMFKSERLQDATVLKIHDVLGIDLDSRDTQNTTHLNNQTTTNADNDLIDSELASRNKWLEEERERLLKEIEHLRADKEDLRNDKKMLSERIGELLKKRDPVHEGDGSTVPAGGSQHTPRKG